MRKYKAKIFLDSFKNSVYNGACLKGNLKDNGVVAQMVRVPR